MNKTTKEMLVTVLAFVIAAAAALAGAAVYAPETAYTQKQNVRVACVPVNYGNERITMDIRIPEVSGLDDSAFETQLNGDIYTQIKTAARAAQNEALELHRDLTAAGYIPWMFVFTAMYEVKSDDGILSLIVSTLLDNGGTGMPHTTVYNVDIAQCARLRLGDLFREDTEYKARINGAICVEMRRTPEKYFEPYDFAGVSEDSTFFVSDGKLYMLFEKYALASGMSGEPVFEIPTNVIADLLKSEYCDLFTGIN